MCDAGTMMVISSAIAAGGAVYSVDSSIKTGNFNKEVADQNAKIQTKIANDAVKRGDIEAAKIRTRAAQIAGSQKTQMAAAGLSLASGNPVDILADTAEFGELDAATAYNNAQREAFGHRVSSTNYLSQGRLDAATGRNNAFSTAINTGSSVGSQWAAFKQAS